MLLSTPRNSRSLPIASIAVLGLCIGWTSTALGQAQKDVAAGHSYHGEAFNEGPRQKAYLMGNTGAVDFKITTQSKQAQAFFNQGVGQLHGFWFFEAERSFRQVAAIDPKCAMAYWGMAQANINNVKRAKTLIAEATKRSKGVSKREKMWIDSLVALYAVIPEKKKLKDGEKAKSESRKVTRARDKKRFGKYADDLRGIIKAFPKDLEAKAFLAVRLWQNARKGWPIKNYDVNEKLFQSVLKIAPTHPIHHYRIHTWDGKKPANALTSAARCGQASPGIAHMWHMPGHIYSKLSRYSDAAWQQEASARVDHAHMMRDWVLPDQIHNFAHNNEWLTRNLMNIGRVRDALSLAKNMVEMPQHPKYNKVSGGKTGSARYGRMRLFTVVTRFELWDEAIELCEGPYLEPTTVESEQLKRLKLLGRAYYQSGQKKQAAQVLGDLDKRLKKAKADSKLKKSASSIQKVVDELKAYELQADGKAKEALAKLKKVRSYDKVDLSMAYLKAGDKTNALKTAKAAVASGKNTLRPLAHQAYVMHTCGQTKEARAVFKKVCELGTKADLDVPLFARLTPLAKAAGKPKDWRNRARPKKDVGKRPALSTLGPFRWSPADAPGWALPSQQGKTLSLAGYRGKPVIVIFYLGAGCPHCIEQLSAFSPMAKAYRDEGIQLIGVSTDVRNRLIDAAKAVDPKTVAFPFPLVSDSSLAVFKTYRAYDDFEKIPLHGTFLISPKGKVLWRDVSYEPFMEAKFLLTEAKRLLAQEKSQSQK
jgi:peroxiredoxin/tetratricopeptide (TPR) repeat protein